MSRALFLNWGHTLLFLLEKLVVFAEREVLKLCTILVPDSWRGAVHSLYSASPENGPSIVLIGVIRVNFSLKKKLDAFTEREVPVVRCRKSWFMTWRRPLSLWRLAWNGVIVSSEKKKMSFSLKGKYFSCAVWCLIRDVAPHTYCISSLTRDDLPSVDARCLIVSISQ